MCQFRARPEGVTYTLRAEETDAIVELRCVWSSTDHRALRVARTFPGTGDAEVLRADWPATDCGAACGVAVENGLTPFPHVVDIDGFSFAVVTGNVLTVEGERRADTSLQTATDARECDASYLGPTTDPIQPTQAIVDRRSAPKVTPPLRVRPP